MIKLVYIYVFYIIFKKLALGIRQISFFECLSKTFLFVYNIKFNLLNEYLNSCGILTVQR